MDQAAGSGRFWCWQPADKGPSMMLCSPFHPPALSPEPTSGTPARCRAPHPALHQARPAGTASVPGILAGALILAQPLLGELSLLMADWLARRATIRRLSRGTLVLQQGEPDRAFYTVLSGSVHLVRHSLSGRSLLLAECMPGDHFGERGLIDGLPRASSARCAEATDLLVVVDTDFQHCLAESASLRLALLRSLSQRLRQSNRRIQMLALDDVQGCVLRHLQDASILDNGQRIVRGPVTRKALADRIGASREMVSRVFRHLAATGRIQHLQDGSLLLEAAAA